MLFLTNHCISTKCLFHLKDVSRITYILGLMVAYTISGMIFISYTLVFSFLLCKKLKKEPSYYMSRRFCIICAQLGNTISFSFAFIFQFTTEKYFFIPELITSFGFTSNCLISDLVVTSYLIISFHLI